MAILHIEKLGGLTGFGGTRARIRSQGQIETATLSAADQMAVDSLFQKSGPAAPPPGADGFRFKISRGDETVEVSESHIPAALASCVKDDFV